jgi:hypothetical protein
LCPSKAGLLILRSATFSFCGMGFLLPVAAHG